MYLSVSVLPSHHNTSTLINFTHSSTPHSHFINHTDSLFDPTLAFGLLPPPPRSKASAPPAACQHSSEMRPLGKSLDL